MQKEILIALIVLALLSGCTMNNLFNTSPNVIFILTDDLDMTLMPYLPQTNQLIGAQGATFESHFITTPICCPSRTSILRGQYAHNTDIMENSPGFARFFKLKEEENTVNVWLRNEGYRTALFGKYLNNYPVNAGREYVPPGWDDWAAFLANQDDGDFFYNYTLNENGRLVEYGNAPEDYSTDVIRDKSLTFIDASVKADSPFFLFVSVYAPHGPATAAPRYEGLYTDLNYPQKPSFNEADISDKPQIIQTLSQTGDEFDEDDADNAFRMRAASLQSVDELVADLVRKLEETGQLQNTYIIFTSDNGFHLGEHRLPSGKGTPYEEDIRVPLLIRGPGIAPGTTVTHMTANMDFAPTIAEMTHSSVPDFVDGRSFLPWLRGEDVQWRDGLLIEFGYIDEDAVAQALADPETDNLLVGVEGGAFRAIRGGDYVYVEYVNGEKEFYDLLNDPYQLENLAGRLSEETLGLLKARLAALKYCAAAECRALEEDLELDFR